MKKILLEGREDSNQWNCVQRW